ncbi:DoxX family protein [Sphingomonas gilva]|uniref:DoxX family protein n=1 Tax=Sphingomonas gilva TaxID=2305907 RepID=A0A396RTX0_9SPHN|nr:DoxX family protein [Sphingomonas gilva]RHW18872.1 DoxX family protein [Sphingomonas gilva]
MSNIVYDADLVARRAGASASRSVWAGRALSGLAVAALGLDAVMKLAAPQLMIDNSPPLGLPADTGFYRMIGAILLAALALHVWRRTAVLGAVLVTAFLGGAVAVNAAAQMPLLSNTLFGVYVGIVFWVGFALRDPRVRAMLSAPL